MKKLVLIGASGIAMEIIDSVFAINDIRATWKILGILDDDRTKIGSQFYREIKVLSSSAEIDRFIADDTFFLVAFCSVSNFLDRPAYIAHLEKLHRSIKFATIIDPCALVSPSSEVKAGTYLAPGVIVDTYASIGSHCIILFNSVVSRFVEIGDYSFLSASVNIVGRKRVGSACYIGVKSTLNGNLSDYVMVSAGTLVRQDITEHSVVSNDVQQDVISYPNIDKMARMLRVINRS